MSEVENPPALPQVAGSGMSLRDYFAGQALLGLITDINSVYNRASDKVNGTMTEEVAFQAYSLADAMLVERDKDRLEQERIEQLCNKSIEALWLTERAFNCLTRDGIKTIRELCTLTKWDILKIPNMGRKSLAELEVELKRNGLKLATTTY